MEPFKYAKRNFPSCSLRSQFTASQKPPLLFPNAKQWGLKLVPSYTQKETSPLAHSVCNSLPHKSHRFCSPMRNNGARNWSHAICNTKSLSNILEPVSRLDLWSYAYIRAREFGFVCFALSLRSLCSLHTLTSLAAQILYPPIQVRYGKGPVLKIEQNL